MTLIAPDTVHFAADTVLGRDAMIAPYVVFGPGVTVETGAEVRSFSHLEGCHVARGAVVGPFADFIAEVEKIAPERRVWVLMDLMGSQTRVAVGADQLRAM